jgi:hypothetical protein
MKLEDADMLKLEKEFFLLLKYGHGEYGGIGLDDKRPMGKSSDVDADILEIIGAVKEGDDGEGPCWSSTQRTYATALYDNLIYWLQTKYCNGLRISHGESQNGEWVYGVMSSVRGKEGNQ